MTWRQAVPTSFTLCAMLAGFFSMVMSAAGDYVLAARLIMLSMVLDGLDGTLARLLKGTSEFGAELDTFVDMTSFGLAPAMLAYLAVLKDFGILGLAMTSAIVLSGVLRLARFRVVDPFRGQKGFLGLPITTNGGWVTLAILLSSLGVIHEDWFSLRSGPTAALVWGGSIIMCGLQISHVRYHKPTKDPAVMVFCTFLTCLLFATTHIAAVASILILGYGFMFAFISPLAHRHHDEVSEDDTASDDEDEDEDEEAFSIHR